MKFNHFIPIIFCFSLMIFACEGPAGPQGEPGPQGPVGPVGPSGEGGSVMLAGTGEPSQNVGSSGDFYIDLSSGNLYGPKTVSGWGAPLSLTGPQGQDGQDGDDGNDGQDGADGSQIFAGDGPPPDTIGEPGDYYLDTENYHLYGPKTEGNWGSFLNLQGPPGTANVRYSQWLERSWNILDNPNWKQMGIDEPAITEELLDRGVIMMYVKGTGSQVQTIPFVEMVSSYRFFAYPGSVQLVAKSTDGSPVDADWIAQVRYVLIPGGMPLKIPDGFWEDYDLVRIYFGLSD